MVKSFDEVEDLTRFADESFDTDTVDLFEFTGNDDSPLTRLKSIILSLDWEITDDILDELVEEVENLRTMWEDDKVAQVYLQGLDKIGKYLRVEGAYAHHNAIKLLLTLFYNYEKIISSSDISGDTITSLLKSDIRKFKVLQYQIGMKKVSRVDSDDQVADTTIIHKIPESENNLLTNTEATILGLDWEVTDEGLEKFNSQADELREHLSNNTHALVLVQGLQAIGAYISEEKVNAHPDAFTLLHTFFDGLKALVEDNDLDNEKRQEIIIEQVSRLNSLKEIIAGTTTPVPLEASDEDVDHVLNFEKPGLEEEPDTVVIDSSDQEAADEVVYTSELTGSDDKFDIDFDSYDSVVDQPAGVQESEEKMEAVASLSGEDEVDIDVQETADSINAAMETADEQYPEEILSPDAIQPLSDEIADEFIEEELSISSEWQPAIDDSDEVGLTFEPEDEGIKEEDLGEEFELLFSDEDEAGKMGSSGDTVAGVKSELELGFDEEQTVEEDSDSSTPDLSESTVDVDQDVEDALDFNEELFLSEDDEDLSPTDDEALITPALADSDEEGGFTEEIGSTVIGDEPSAELEDKLDSFFDISEDDEPESAIGDDEEQSSTGNELVTPALVDAGEDGGFSEDVESEGLGEEPSTELEDKLDSFFDISEEKPDIEQEPESLRTETVDTVDDTVVAALEDADEVFEGGFREEEVVAKQDEDPTDDLQNKLDSFFGSDDEPKTETVAEKSSTPLDEEPDSFFTEDETLETDQEADETMPALSDADESSGFDEEEVVTGLADTAMEEIDDKLDSFFDVDKEDSDPAATPIPALTSLAAIAAELSPAPAATDLQQIADLVAVGKKENHGTNQTVLLTLIDSAVALLAKNNKAAEGNSAIVQKLIAGVEDADNPTTFIEAISRYTTWQQDLFDKINSRQDSADTVMPSAEITDNDVMLQVQSGFSQLRSTLMNEFETIRKEFKKE